jgi:acyl-CoA reductase-like NAD-dependent aldehyde dehydrogenase
VSQFVEQSKEQGVDVATGGKRAAGDLSSGSFYEPTVLLNVSDTHTVAREEIFGPVLAVQKFGDCRGRRHRADQLCRKLRRLGRALSHRGDEGAGA